MDPSAEAIAASIDDPVRFAEIFDLHHRTIWRYIARSYGPDMADDLAGDVFVSAFQNRHRFDPGRGAVRTWLYGIATNTMRMTARTAGRAMRAERRLLPERDTDDPTAVVDEADELGSRLDEIRRALPRLDDRDFEVLTLVVWEDLTYGEAAAVLDIPIGTVRSRLSRARARLRSLVDDDRTRRPQREVPK